VSASQDNVPRLDPRLLLEAAEVDTVSVLSLDVAGEVAWSDELDAEGAVGPGLNRTKQRGLDKCEFRPHSLVLLLYVLLPVPVCAPAWDAGSRLVPCHPDSSLDYNNAYRVRPYIY
jgi:hypothetical protein